MTQRFRLHVPDSVNATYGIPFSYDRNHWLRHGHSLKGGSHGRQLPWEGDERFEIYARRVGLPSPRAGDGKMSLVRAVAKSKVRYAAVFPPPQTLPDCQNAESRHWSGARPRTAGS